MKEYLENEIENLETEIRNKDKQIEDLQLRRQYKIGRLEAYKATLAHLLKPT